MTEEFPNAATQPHPYLHHQGEVTALQLAGNIATYPDAYHPGLDPYMQTNGIDVQRPAFEDDAVAAAESQLFGGHDWAEIAAAAPPSPVHAAVHRELGAKMDPNYASLSPDKQLAVSLAAELGAVDIAEASRRNKFQEALRDNPTSGEVLSRAVDRLQTEKGEYTEVAAITVTKCLRQQIQETGTTSNALEKELADRPQLLQSMISYAGNLEASDWDKAAIKLAVDRSASKLAERNVPFSWDGDVTPTPAQARLIEADKTEAEQLRAQVEVLELPKKDLSRMFMQYGKLAEAGITLDNANVYDKLRPLTYKSEPTAEQVSYVAQHYESAGRVTKQLLNANKYAPDRLLQAGKYIEQAAADLDDNPKAQEKVAAEAAIFLRCEGYRSGEDNQQVNATVEELVGRGADIRGIINILGDPQAYDMYRSAEPGERTEQAKQLVAVLASHPELHYSEVNPCEVIAKLLADPTQYEPSLAAVQKEWPAVLQNGYPSSVAARKIEYIFTSYANNLHGTRYGGENIDGAAVRANYLRSNLEAMRLLGGSSVELQQLTEGKVPQLDRYADALAGKLYDGEAVEAYSFRTNVISAAESVRELSQEQPELYQAIVKYTQFGNDGKLEDVKAYLDMSAQLTERLSFIQSLPSLDTRITSLESVVNKVSGTFDHKNRAFNDGVFTSLDSLQMVLEGVPGLYDVRNLTERFVGQPDGEHAQRFAELLQSEYVQSLMAEERTASEINKALFVLDVYQGGYDLPKGMDIFRSIDRPVEGWLEDILRAEVKLGGSARNRAAQKFYELAPRVLSRRDKDGTPYDSPDMLAKVLAPLRWEGNERYAAEIDWFMAGELPAAAAESMVYFHEQALAVGIEDNPSAVYEWVHKDPNKVSELSQHYLERYLTRESGMGMGMPKLTDEIVKRLVESMDEKAEHMQNDFRLLLNVSPDALQKIIANGQIKSMLDADVEVAARDDYYAFQRSGVEVALGIRSMQSDEAHPIYGSIGYVGDGVPSGAIGYGDVMLTFKPTDDILARTSFTPEDSFHGAQRLTMQDAQILRLIKSGVGMGHMKTSEYVEFQTQGGFDLSEIDEIYVSDAKMAENLQESLPEELRAKVRVRGEDDTYAASREKAAYNAVVSNALEFA